MHMHIRGSVEAFRLPGRKQVIVMLRKKNSQGADQGTAVVTQPRCILKSALGIKSDIQMTIKFNYWQQNKEFFPRGRCGVSKELLILKRLQFLNHKPIFMQPKDQEQTPFFARFLEKQEEAAQQDVAQEAATETTLKFPSDNDDSDWP
jgi:hypothetical protein